MRESSVCCAKQCLEELGLVAEDIEVAPPEKRADLRCQWESEEYIFEAKLRKPHQGWNALFQQANEGISSTITRSVEPWSALAKTIKKAYSQLMATPCSENAFRILWAVAPHEDDDFVITCLEKRLVGTQRLIAINEPLDLDASTPQSIDCYHYSQNSFEQCTGMDGAILSTRTGARLFVNYYSANRSQFRDSYLYRKFADKSAVVDPEIDVQNGKALMLANDFSGPRNGTRQWEYLKQNYSLLTVVAPESQINGLVVS